MLGSGKSWLSDRFSCDLLQSVDYTGCLKKKYRCLITYIRKTRIVIALK